VFFYCNLPLGQPLAADLLAFERAGVGRIKTHLRLRRWDELTGAAGDVMADLVTERQLMEPRP
jgi:hypothetical protein